jgi:hypothetical protein
MCVCVFQILVLTILQCVTHLITNLNNYDNVVETKRNNSKTVMA